jgi:hypothetical protein
MHMQYQGVYIAYLKIGYLSLPYSYEFIQYFEARAFPFFFRVYNNFTMLQNLKEVFTGIISPFLRVWQVSNDGISALLKSS